MAKNKDYLRVTQVLSPFSGLSKVNPIVLSKAGERGSKVHEICTAVMDEIGIFPFGNTYDGYIESFKKWMDGKKFIDRPSRFYCDKYMITGEIDAIYQDKEDLVLIDIKTSSKENKTWPLQGSAYAYLCRQNGYNISRIEFIQLSKMGNEAKIYSYKENFDMFLKCLDVYKTFFDKEEDYMEYI
jgi:Holliday junction resolvase-like predicted endonuclease